MPRRQPSIGHSPQRSQGFHPSYAGLPEPMPPPPLPSAPPYGAPSHATPPSSPPALAAPVARASSLVAPPGASGADLAPWSGQSSSLRDRSPPGNKIRGSAQIRDAEMSVEYLCRRFEVFSDQLQQQEQARESAERRGKHLA